MVEVAVGKVAAREVMRGVWAAREVWGVATRERSRKDAGWSEE